MKIAWKDTIKEIIHNKRAVAGILAGIVVLLLIIFLAVFRVNTVTVLGSTHYTDQEIKEYALKNPLTSNSVLAMLFCKNIEAEDIPFLESFELERLNAHTLRIHVNEKKIVGYIVQNTEKMYFDKDGLVVEEVAMEEEELQAFESREDELKALKEEADRQAALEAANEAEQALTGEVQGAEEDGASGGQEATVLQAEEFSSGNEAATEFHAAVTDVPRIVGLDIGQVTKGDIIELEDDSIFNTILGITRMVEKYGILPEIVYFDESGEITLVYNDGTIHCQLGKDTLLEEKITRVAAILPFLSDQTGILHLEDYSTDTVNIIFKKTSEYELKSKIAAAEGLSIQTEQEENTQDDQSGETDPAGET